MSHFPSSPPFPPPVPRTLALKLRPVLIPGVEERLRFNGPVGVDETEDQPQVVFNGVDVGVGRCCDGGGGGGACWFAATFDHGTVPTGTFGAARFAEAVFGCVSHYSF